MANRVVPSNLKEVLVQCMEVAEATIEGTVYLADQFDTLLDKTKTRDKYAEPREGLQNFVTYNTHRLSRSSTGSWLGEINDSSDYQNMQRGMAQDAIKNIKDHQVGTTNSAAFEFAVNDQSEFLRGYAADGKALDSKTLASMDTLFNAFLAQNSIVSHGSALYEADKKGNRKLDDNGVPIKADPQKVRDLINDPVSGYAKYLDSNGLHFSCSEQEYPTPQKEAQVEEASTSGMRT